MEICDETTAQYMAEALLNHAKDIHRYAKTYCESSLANEAIEERHKRKFVRVAQRMINEMHALMLMAGYKGVSRFCNKEQIEAYMDEAKRAIAGAVTVGQSAAILN